jgi:hypothetical protein
MQKHLTWAAAAVLLVAAAPARALDMSYDLLSGWQNGIGFRGVATAQKVIAGAPVAFSFGFGHTLIDPGDALLARHVFINDNTNGTPEKSGTVNDFRLDAVWLLDVARLEDAGVFGGVRYSMFQGRFHYVDGNEDFDVLSNDWALGVGFRGAFAVSRQWSISLSAGLDWFPSRSLYGHDATYNSNGTSVNARGDYGWADASRAINHPALVPSLLFGMSWRP